MFWIADCLTDDFHCFHHSFFLSQNCRDELQPKQCQPSPDCFAIFTNSQK
jgi:hypothetical protein